MQDIDISPRHLKIVLNGFLTKWLSAMLDMEKCYLQLMAEGQYADFALDATTELIKTFTISI